MRTLLGLLLLVSATFTSVSAAATIVSQDSVKRIVETHQLQTTLPLNPSLSEEKSKFPQFNLPSGVADTLLWLMVLTGAGVVIWSMRDSLPMFDRSRKISGQQDEIGHRSHSNEMVQAQIEADDLASQGHYAEAMHLLLLQSLLELKKRLGLAFADSLTSREILRRANISDLAKKVLGNIIHTVEFTHFGEKSAGRDDYITCRDQFDFLKSALSGHAKA
jgi:hypothetical protein